MTCPGCSLKWYSSTPIEKRVATSTKCPNEKQCPTYLAAVGRASTVGSEGITLLRINFDNTLPT